VKRSIIVHFHEINLKGNNRGWFESHLQQHIAAVLKELPRRHIQRFAGRLIIGLDDNSPAEEIARRLSMIYGIANFAVAREVEADMEAIKSGLKEMAASAQFASFKIDSRRGTKTFPLNSQQLNQQLGAFVQELSKAKVRMENPDTTFFIELVGDRAFLYLNKTPGAGGLPTGTGGKVLCLISGGIDSPVAAFRLMRRGCRVAFVHFHSFPHTTLESQDKVKRLIQILSGYQLESRLHMVPFAEIQREIVAYAPPPLRVVLYRRFMLRIAEAIAEKEKAAALVTGDSLGQVASQTLENIRTISAAAKIPVFRPLIGSDKEEIIQTARAIGTYDVSIMADQDCCSLFIPRHPETMSSIKRVEDAEANLDAPKLIQAAMEGASRELVLADFSENAVQAAKTIRISEGAKCRMAESG
jgi:thiamine biosynthesis protein ThiI